MKLGGSPSSKSPAAAPVTRLRSPSLSAGSSPSSKTPEAAPVTRSPSTSAGHQVRNQQLAAFKAKHGLASVKLQRFTSGARVQHPTRGAGTVVEIDSSDRHNKPYKVKLDNGEVKYYSEESSSELQVLRHEKKQSPKTDCSSRKARATSFKPRDAVEDDKDGEPSPRPPESMADAPGLSSIPRYLAGPSQSPPNPLSPRSRQDLCMVELTAMPSPERPEQDTLKSENSEACNATQRNTA